MGEMCYQESNEMTKKDLHKKGQKSSKGGGDSYFKYRPFY